MSIYLETCETCDVLNARCCVETVFRVHIYAMFCVRLAVFMCVYSVSQKSSLPKTFYIIFTQVKYIIVKLCQYVASLYVHIFTNFGGFIYIFNKMALIFLGVPIVFNVFSFKFHQVKSP